jgi:hypothetical protein
MSEKTIRSSGICAPFLAARLPRTDDPDVFLFTVRPPYRVNQQQNPTCDRAAEANESFFDIRVPRGHVERERIGKDSCRLLKSDAMLFAVSNRLGGVPREHIYVYMLIAGGRQIGPADRPIASGFGCGRLARRGLGRWGA